MTQEEKVSFSKFGRSFQEDLCQLILDDRIFCDQIEEVLDVEFLELKFLRVFVKKILDYRDEYKVHPSYKMMATIFRSELDAVDGATKVQARDFLARIYRAELAVEGSEYIKRTALDFCKKQKLKEAILRSVKLLEDASYDEISDVINEAIKLGDDNNFGYDYLKDFEERFQIKARNPVATGWKHIDDLIRDGMGMGELGVVIAPTGAGKSMVLVHLGTQALKAGKTVIHYTLELQDTVIGNRYDSCLTGVHLGELTVFKEKIYEKVSELKGKLIIKEYPTKSASTKTIFNHLQRLKKRGIEADMIIIDYADLLKPKVNRKEKRMELESIYEELRGLGQQFKAVVWTASQTNRSGLNAEVITMESISEAFNKCFVADFIFSVSRTIQDKRANTGRLFVAKNRNGPDGIIFPVNMDTSNVKIEVLAQSEDTIESIATATAKEQEKLLKEKYSKFKKGANK